VSEIDRLRSLDRGGDRDPPPIDVTAGVLRAIRAGEREDDVLLSAAALAAVAVGAVAVVVALQGWTAASDPVAPLAEPFRWVIG